MRKHLLTALLLLSAAPVARAQPRAETRADPVAGEALFREGRRLLKAGDLAGACARFEESHRLDPAIGTRANLADCQEKLGRLASAWQHWRFVADQLPAGDPRRAMALTRAAALETTVPRLTVELAADQPSGLAIERDGIPLGKASLGVALPLDPGAHQVTVRAPGRPPLTYDVTVAAGEQRRLQVAAGPTGPVAPPPVAASAASAAPASIAITARPGERSPAAGRWRRRAGWALVGAGAVGLGAGTYFALHALKSRSDARKACTGAGDPPSCWSNARLPLARDRYFSRMTDLSFVAGAAALAGGGYLLFTTRQRELRAAVVPAAGGGEVALAFQF